MLIVHSMWRFLLHVEMIFVMYLFSYSHWTTMESIQYIVNTSTQLFDRPHLCAFIACLTHNFSPI